MLEAAGDEVVDVTWLGTATGMEAAIVADRGLRYRTVSTGPIVGASPARLALGLVRIARGTARAWRLLGRERPDAVFVTGGYVSVPVALAARLRRVPLVVYLPDVLPGRAVAAIARIADRIAVTSPDSLPHLPQGRAVATGYPVRPAVRTADRRVERERLGLGKDTTLLLVFGGSRGARRLNEAVVLAAETLLERSAILHVTGSLDHERVAAARATLPPTAAARYGVREFLDDSEMAAALAAADLAVSRAGAAVMGEYPATGLPSILVPLPIAGGHQRANAEVLMRAGAAMIVPDAELTADRLAAVVSALLDAPERLGDMSRAARGLDRPDAALGIWQVVRAAATGAAGACP